MKHKQVLVITHRLYFNNEPKLGGIDRIMEHLKKDNDITLVEHPFEKINHPSVFTAKHKKYAHASITRGPLLWIEECMITTWWILRSGEKYDLAIGADPLTFFFCNITKKLGKANKTQFHSTDYSSPRFANKILESIYQSLYRYAINSADTVTVVSDRMKEEAGRGYLLPNSPNFDEVPKIPISKKNPNDLVFMVGKWGIQVDERLLFEVLENIKKKHPRITLHVIGHVDERHKKKQSNVVYHGAVSYMHALQKMSECYIGITAYKATESYVHYADSLKIREYAAAGLPIVCDAIYATAEEVKKYDAGFVYKTPQEMAAAIIRLIETKQTYEEKSKNALRWAKKMDKKKLLDKLYI